MGSKDVQAEDLTVRRSGDLTPLGSLRDIESTEPTVITGSDKVLGLGTGQGSGNSATESGRFERVGSTGPAVPAEPPGHGSPAEVARVLLGHQLDHFQLESLIGGGGMGAVFRARDTRLDRTVAIKVIPRVGDDPELLRRFRNEAQSAARLDHPNIARVYDVGRFEGWHYIVFEYIEGTNVRDLVEQQGLLSVDDAVFYTRQVAEALEHAHRRGVTHRDIKPSNVLITTGGQVKLVDMGLARAQQLEMSEDMTASGVTLGTFDYISPEQARDPRDADVRSDIYSLGCTLYFMLTGQPPYPSGTVLQKLLSHGASPPPDPRVIRTGLSDNLVAILHKMLAKQPDNRYRRPVDLISDLYLLAEREHLPRTLSIGSIAIVPANRFGHLLEKHLPWMVAVACLLISVAWLQLLSLASNDLTLTESVPPPRALRGGEGSELGASTDVDASNRNVVDQTGAEPNKPLADNAAANRSTSVTPEQAGASQPATSTPAPRPSATTGSGGTAGSQTTDGGSARAVGTDSAAGDSRVNLDGTTPANNQNVTAPLSGNSAGASEKNERDGMGDPSPTVPSNLPQSSGAMPVAQPPGTPATNDGDARLDGTENASRGTRRPETVVVSSTTGDGQAVSQPADLQPSNLLTRLTDALAVSSDNLVDVRRRNENGSSPQALPSEGAQGKAGGMASPGYSDQSSGTGEPRVAAPVPPTVIRIVGAQDPGAGTIDANNRLLVTTLSDALAAAAVDLNIQVIEIGPGKQQSGPVTIPRRGLTLRGATARDTTTGGEGAELATQLEFVTNDPASMERPAMIRLGNHNLDIDQLHLVWRCPASAVDGGSLFQVQGGNTLRLNRSLVTIENELSRPNVHVVESELKLGDEANPPLVAVKLTDCIVRGDLTLLASDQAGLIEVRWDNGLLVAGQGMIETGGAANRAAAMAARVRLIMNDVTAVMEGPLVAERLVSGANQPIAVDREANRCVFSFPANSAMLEVSGLPELAALERIVSMRGSDNYYDSSRGKTQFYVIGSSLDRSNLRFSVADLMSGSLPKWAGESSPQAVVYWTRIPPSPLNSHLRSPGDFLQEGVVLPGFIGERLPKVQLPDGVVQGEGI